MMKYSVPEADWIKVLSTNFRITQETPFTIGCQLGFKSLALMVQHIFPVYNLLL